MSGIHNNTGWIVVISAPIIASAVIAVAGLLWNSNTTLTMLSAQQDNISQQIESINEKIGTYETKTHAKEKYQGLWRTDQDQYKRIKENVHAINKLGSRVQSLEDSNKYGGYRDGQ